MTGAELGLAIGLGVLGAGVGGLQASQQNRAAGRAASSARLAAQIQSRQVAEAAQLERLKAFREAELVRGRVRVAAAAAGIAPDIGVFNTLLQQEAFDYAINQSIIERNAQNQIASVLSGGAANIAQIRSQMQNPFLSGLSGAIQGAQTGLAIGGAINSIGSAMQAPNIGGVGGAPSYGGGFGPRTGGFGSPTAFA